MAPRTNARVAGFTFLFYIAVGITGLMLSSRATAGDGIAARLAGVAQHVTQMRLALLITLLEGACALVLAVTLHALTRGVDRDVAMFGLVCRVGEGVTGVFLPSSLGLVWLATGAEGLDPAARQALGSFLLNLGAWSPAATLFALGSTAFCWLFLRGRLIPVPLAWIGVAASVLLVVVLPLQLAGFATGAVTRLVWLPMLLFEVPLGVWFIVKGAPLHPAGGAE